MGSKRQGIRQVNLIIVNPNMLHVTQYATDSSPFIMVLQRCSICYIFHTVFCRKKNKNIFLAHIRITESRKPLLTKG